MEYNVVHNREKNCFEAIIGDRVAGMVSYIVSADSKRIIVPHTEVSEEFEGRGIAGEMTKVLLEYVRKEGMKISPLCAYTSAYINRHPEYQDLLDK